MRTAALFAITLYKRYLSPHKGFVCAYRAHTGCASCSSLGFRVIRRYGVWKGCGLLSLRLQRCGVAHRRYRWSSPGGLHAQQGFVDCDCDLPDLDCASGACDTFSGCGMADGCDLPGRKKPSPEQEAAMHIPQHKPAGLMPQPARGGKLPLIHHTYAILRTAYASRLARRSCSLV